MATCQLVVFPPFIKMVGISAWQRLGCGVGVAAFVAVPAVKTLSWGYNSLFFGSVLVNATVALCLGAVSAIVVLVVCSRRPATHEGTSTLFLRRKRVVCAAIVPVLAASTCTASR